MKDRQLNRLFSSFSYWHHDNSSGVSIVPYHCFRFPIGLANLQFPTSPGLVELHPASASWGVHSITVFTLAKYGLLIMCPHQCTLGPFTKYIIFNIEYLPSKSNMGGANYCDYGQLYSFSGHFIRVVIIVIKRNFFSVFTNFFNFNF